MTNGNRTNVNAVYLDRCGRPGRSVQTGCHGVVASPRDAAPLRAGLRPDTLIVTPGVTSAGIVAAVAEDACRYLSTAGVDRVGASDGTDIGAAIQPGGPHRIDVDPL